ncbi:MAG TPA: TIGR03668 family PPOX class F420-dependent oxidoreductase [Candidatus Binataceae bacterium]|jgi:PPOX class probable F420-dependent enzyme|nr:TIGR03668 family PPOX class F420-dependent oxidoreductase [Candidatus Binataceae bacterium]
MAADSLQLLVTASVRDFLTFARIGHLATADGAGVPHNVPLCFWFDGVHFYFAIDEKPKRGRAMALRRMRNIAANPNVALVVDHYEEHWSNLAYVLVHGQASVVDTREEYLLALRNLRDKYPQYRVMVLSIENNPVVRIEPARVHVWGERFKPVPAAPARPQSRPQSR